MPEAVGGCPASFKDVEGLDSPRPVCGHVRASQVRVARNLLEGGRSGLLSLQGIGLIASRCLHKWTYSR